MNELLKRFRLDELGAVKLGNCYAIRPYNACGTCGWDNGRPWTAVYMKVVPKGIKIED